VTTTPTHATRDRIPVRVDHVETEVVDSEVLLYHPQRTTAVYLNPAAGLVWGLCDGARSVADIIAVLVESYPDAEAAIAEDVREAVESLQKDGMIVLR
jgi:coenzyme PQQ biosynthesis protein PqqD